MKRDCPRVRMFAGPNGSGKSTMKTVLEPRLLGIYINPDEIEKEIARFGFLDLAAYGVNCDEKEILSFFCESPFLASADLLDEAEELRFSDQKLSFFSVALNSYFASVSADFLRRKLLEMRTSFTFETVMSSPDKVGFLKDAQGIGYRTYLYYVATEDPSINISRIRARVRAGGHSVPEDKIASRYSRSLTLLPDAVRATNRAYIFDNSGDKLVWIAEITDGVSVELRDLKVPNWFKSAFLDEITRIE